MNDTCSNCDAEISDGGFLKTPNRRYSARQVSFVNFVTDASYPDLCEKCGDAEYRGAVIGTKAQREECRQYVQDHIVDFPMMTISQVPPGARCRIKSMVTANVTVGTGFFNELSQGFSDMFGATNVATGMAFKVNSGEATARSVLVEKAIAMGANCVIGVDIDYGTTNNNAATVNMQGTAVVIENLENILSDDVLERFRVFEEKRGRVQEISRWLAGDFEGVAVPDVETV
ncbi:heavy metal-binding domain-containing protein [Novosphingobium sp. TCA1]|uniref:heavy metal-binding domain-containing protein n=1 Tax=Novosphingobium sp. TCA1 TaxID=2682474 RepID=UPI00130C1C61|nr:heavy metal-binding domain-containing protein [Novosphingobium sp. TCA1]GFE76152.1 hypothetical protein NTCA1_38010 [Novosphingobium sp. TCA1]